MSRRTSSRDAILDAAEAVVAEAGAAHLTLDAVAQRAGLSKGGLIYNFPTKVALLSALIERVVQRFDAAAARGVERFGAGGVGAIKAVIAATISDEVVSTRVGNGLLAAAANDPQMLDPIRARYREKLAEIAAAGMNFERAAILSLATDGLRFWEMFGASPFTAEQRERIVAELFKLADQAGPCA
jgi:AcrR family transcriptional regulator